MAKPKGSPKTGGRKKGTRNRKTAATVLAIEASGITPLNYMLGLMRQDTPKGADLNVRIAIAGQRFEAAKAAAPYVHPKLAAIEHTGKHGKDLLPPIFNIIGVPGRK